jgi:hypothetical protein
LSDIFDTRSSINFSKQASVFDFSFDPENLKLCPSGKLTRTEPMETVKPDANKLKLKRLKNSIFFNIKTLPRVKPKEVPANLFPFNLCSFDVLPIFIAKKKASESTPALTKINNI